MTNEEKSDLAWYIKKYVRDGESNEFIIDQMQRLGFKKSTIKRYIDVFRPKTATN